MRATPATRSRPDLPVHDYVVRLPFAAAVKELVDILGRKLTGYVGGMKDVRAVDEWAEGTRVPRERAELKVKFALEIAKLVAEHDNRRVAQAWFQGLNPQLDDRSPARLLSEGELEEVAPLIRAAARAFLVGG